MKPKAQFRIVGHDWTPDGERAILIEDLNGPMSVTNDAEAVVADLLAAGYADFRFIYKDSMGQWDELLHNELRFTGFGPGYTPKLVVDEEDEAWTTWQGDSDGTVGLD